MKLQIKKGTTSKTIKIFVQNNSVSTGLGLTGLTSGSSGLIAYYIREGQNGTTQISLSGGTLGTWSSGGFIEVDSAHMAGFYELGLPNAMLATGANTVHALIGGATNMAPVPLEIQLTDTDVNDGNLFGLTGLSFKI